VNLQTLTAASPLLRDLTATDLAFFESIAREVTVGKGDTLFEEGGAADTFYIVCDGRIGLEMTSPGRQPMVIQTLGRGDLVGLSWFFAPARWNWRARALADTTLMAFDAAAVRHRCEEEPKLALHVLRVIASETADRLHRTRIQLLDLYRNRGE
jgi:CRP/FNR family transcriptional regulator, cyclic AMP receptor protein